MELIVSYYYILTSLVQDLNTARTATRSREAASGTPVSELERMPEARARGTAPPGRGAEASASVDDRDVDGAAPRLRGHAKQAPPDRTSESSSLAASGQLPARTKALRLFIMGHREIPITPENMLLLMVLPADGTASQFLEAGIRDHTLPALHLHHSATRRQMWLVLCRS